MKSLKDAVKQSSQGVLLCLHVVPGSSQAMFPAGYNQWRNCIEIKVRSEAKENQANVEVVETIARFFQLSTHDVQVLSGQKSREKTVVLSKLSVDVVCRKLEGSLNG
jgi:uncharacterized protein